MKTKISANNSAQRYAVTLLFILSTLLGCLFLLQFSLQPSFDAIAAFIAFLTEDIYGLLNLATIGTVFALVFIVSNRLWLAGLFCSLFFGIISIINYYVIQLHSMPLSFLVLRNFNTAMNVISGYRLEISCPVIFLVAGTVCLSVLSIVFRSIVAQPPSQGFPWLRNGVLALICLLTFYISYLGPDPIKPTNTLGWSWQESYHTYGYAASTIESFFQLRDVCVKPEDYSQEEVDQTCAQYLSSATEDPGTALDMILILNESFYDLEQITSVNADTPYLSNIDTMDNLLRGYAVSANSGGGTNTAEYELLTSNSLKLMPGVTPFNTVNLTDASSIVSHMNALGYYSLGTHTEPALNYSRGMAYPTLGFQTSYFSEAYQNLTYYGERWYESDESAYQNLIRWYEEAPEDVPRFMYMLTIQNHGSWDLSPAKYDIVHTGQDFGANTELVNEYLTCIHQSDAAFKMLTDYFSTVDRPVIICMTGDHSPTFVTSIADSQYSGSEFMLRLRKVPLLIWANFPLEQQDLGTMSMNMVVPTLLEIADIELSPYYRFLLDLKEQVPILTAYGDYYDKDGNLYKYDSDDESPYKTMVDTYFNLEYQNIATKNNRAFYSPYSGE